MMRRYLTLCVTVLGMAWAGPAHAFSDRFLFTDPTLAGGGGGRFFTGSPADGYSCNVCHSGGVTPEVTVFGLPVDGYEPGQTYAVELQWTQPDVPHSLNLELVTAAGAGAGVVTLLAPEQVGANGRCGQAADGEVAAYMIEAGSRRIVGVGNCGASSLRFNFTAPADDEIAFAGAVVRTDDSTTETGDGVLELRKVLRRRGLEATTTGATSCAVPPLRRPGFGGSAPLALSVFMLAALLYRTRARTRCASRA